MKLDRLIQILLPHDEKFYQFFEESAKNLVKGADLFTQLFDGTMADHEKVITKMHELEHFGDAVTHKIFAELSATFVTPFDREDIHVLASALDDVMDYIDGSASRFQLYKLDRCPEPMRDLVRILQNSVVELERGVSLLRDFRRSAELQKVLERINEFENEADEVFAKAIADLFEREHDAITIIKLKEIYVGLETATDKCEDAANVLETLLIKHA
jgi:predicted phosphate transport protein (TIGR00153 family)